VQHGSARTLPALRHLALVEDPGLAGATAEFLNAAGTRA
jgi:hypothetical protein